MKTIHKLTSDVIDQIAAGEVVESPDSVIKELIENALDAKASKISVAIEKGGEEEILVSDNGSGMEKEDAYLSVERHATSKISGSKDLFALSTMGFRGEALASIAAVSKFSLKTAAKNLGTEILIEGGKLIKGGVCAKNPGTEIRVRSLFYNTPARKKFQKGRAAKTSKVIRLMQAAALSHPEVHFHLLIDKKPVIDFLPSNLSFKEVLKERARYFLGESFANGREVDVSDGDFTICGILAPSSLVRTNRLGQYVFINGRWVDSPLISKAVKEAYGTALLEKEYPSFVLHFSMPKEFIDVNVHPQKKEVRFQDPHFLRRLIPELLAPPSFRKMPVISTPVFEKRSFPINHEQVLFEERAEELPEPALFVTPEKRHFEEVVLLGRFFFLKEENDLFVMDLGQAFHELFSKKRETVSSQKLLVPFVFEMGQDEIQKIDAHLPKFLEKGIEIRILGKHTLSVDALPVNFQEKDAKSLLLTLLDGFSLSENLEKKLLFFAKKRDFSLEEARGLLDIFSSDVLDTMFQKIGKEQAAKLFDK